jgi:hypothetical protein
MFDRLEFADSIFFLFFCYFYNEFETVVRKYRKGNWIVSVFYS